MAGGFDDSHVDRPRGALETVRGAAECLDEIFPTLPRCILFERKQITIERAHVLLALSGERRHQSLDPPVLVHRASLPGHETLQLEPECVEILSHALRL